MIKVEDLLKFYNWNTTHISMGKCHQLKEEGYLHMKTRLQNSPHVEVFEVIEGLS